MKERQDVAREILTRCPRGAARVAEIGVEVGKLSRTLLNANKLLTLVMVDNWLTAVEQPGAYSMTMDPSAFKTADDQANRKIEAHRVADHYAPRAKIIEASSDEASRCFEDQHFDLVFLDADHSFDGVDADVINWKDRVKRGGYIGGHDYGNPSQAYDFSGVKKAVDLHFARERIELGADFTWFVRRTW